MLQVILGADDHTAAEGAYARALKARKWLFLAAGAGSILAFDLYSADQASQLLKFITLPEWFLERAFGFALLYLVTQYSLLLFQVRTVYDLELQERFAAKLMAEREVALAAVTGGQSNVAAQRREIDRLERAFFRDRENADDPRGARSHFETQMESHHWNLRNAEEGLSEAQTRYDSLDERDPAKRGRFVWTERWIDRVRLVVPLIISALVLALLVFDQF
ncbi:hypothetical protein GCM10009422_17570 [Brevundimonas kwangchunensis]|uniref:SMODS and SLOG-associating 2TM effector domain-containing protein n=1 Tax=Brevundimonas kwangchunensis TaxID=322163 RepID=A0ABN1GWT7_9CAUL